MGTLAGKNHMQLCCGLSGSGQRLSSKLNYKLHHHLDFLLLPPSTSLLSPPSPSLFSISQPLPSLSLVPSFRLYPTHFQLSPFQLSYSLPPPPPPSRVLRKGWKTNNFHSIPVPSGHCTDVRMHTTSLMNTKLI